VLIAHHTSSSCSSFASTDLSGEAASGRVVACAVVWILASISAFLCSSSRGVDGHCRTSILHVVQDREPAAQMVSVKSASSVARV